MHFYLYLSAAVDATPHAIVAITVPATTMLTMSHLYRCKQAYKDRYSVINCDKSIYLMLGFIVTIKVIYVMLLPPSFGKLAIGLAYKS